MDEPGSFSGRINSPRPQRGPDPKNLISFAIFIKEHASTFNAPDTSTIVSWAANASNLFGADTKGKPVNSPILAAHFSAKPILVFKPVPTAVPPNASSYKWGRVCSTRFIPFAIC